MSNWSFVHQNELLAVWSTIFYLLINREQIGTYCCTGKMLPGPHRSTILEEIKPVVAALQWLQTERTSISATSLLRSFNLKSNKHEDYLQSSTMQRSHHTYTIKPQTHFTCFPEHLTEHWGVVATWLILSELISTQGHLWEHSAFWYLSYQRKQSWCFSCRVLVRALNVLTKYQLGVQLPVTPMAEEMKSGNLPMCRTSTEGRAVSVPAAGGRLICHLQWCVYNVPAADDIQRNILIKNNGVYQRSSPSLHTPVSSYKCRCLQCLSFPHLKH